MRIPTAAILLFALGVTGCGNSGRNSVARPGDNTSAIQRLPVKVGSPPLDGLLTLPARRGRSTAVVLVSGSGPQDKDETGGPNKPFRDLAEGLAERGIASLRYDKRTKAYPPAANPADFTPTQEYVPDALAAINLLRSRPEVDPKGIYVLGHSQGGTYAPKIAQDHPAIAGVILLAAASQPFGATILRQLTYLASLPGAQGAQPRAALPKRRRSQT